MAAVPNGTNIDEMRSYYVGLTRAKQNLYLIPNAQSQANSVSFALTMRDVWLDFYKGRKDIILRLRSGDALSFRDDHLQNVQGINVVALSSAGKEKLNAWRDKGYEVTNAEVSYILAWHPKDSITDYAVCLANIVLSKKNRGSEE